MDSHSIIQPRDNAGFSISSLLKQHNNGIIGGKKSDTDDDAYSTLFIPYSLYTPNQSNIENENDAEHENELNSNEHAVIDDDMYDNLLALMDAEPNANNNNNTNNEEEPIAPSKHTIELIVTEIDSSSPSSNKKGDETPKHKKWGNLSKTKCNRKNTNKHKSQHKRRSTTTTAHAKKKLKNTKKKYNKQ